MKYRLCLFDFDGTLADTLEESRLILNELAEDYGFRQVELDEMSALRSLTAKQLFKELGIKKRWVPMLLAKGKRKLKDKAKDIQPIEGMMDAVQEIATRTEFCGILTSNTVENVELFLEQQQMSGVFEFVSSVSKLSGKHKHLKSIMRTFSLKPNEVLYVGDELRDVKAARKAGVDMAAVGWGFNSMDVLRESRMTYAVETMDELLEVVLEK